MWIFLIYGVFSISVKDGMVIVRGRDRKHLENLKRRFKEKWHIQDTPSRDYGFRMVMSKARWVEVMKALAEEQDWHNFKNAARDKGKTDARYLSLLHDVWDLVYKRLQGRVDLLKSPEIKQYQSDLVDMVHHRPLADAVSTRTVGSGVRLPERWPKGVKGGRVKR